MNNLISESTLPRLCFVHVPKTAGSSLNKLFSELYGDLKLPALTTLDYGLYSQDKLKAYRFYSGHCYWRDYSRLPSDARIFTVLRDPVARVVSLYKYWGSISTEHLTDKTMIEAMQTARDSSIYDFISSENPFIRESIVCGQIRQFLRPDLEQKIEVFRQTDSGLYQMVTQIYDTFSRFEAVLTVERLSESLPIFLKKLGIATRRTIPHVNSSPSRNDVDFSRVRELLFDSSYVDFLIYDLAQALEEQFVRQWKLETPVLEEEIGRDCL
ncbi:sulfotransferase family 2 domain-containing protein (plasmid) [Rhizobium sp. CB3090]|uniref:sulfotransferase family 2 domain-containing protein n=1 Tax=Rhizobium sp. CB3090 TaxID=3039156 RepID=UPI0024B1E1D6|nr:sulfotransferase family 2 domain-containing protein [Rhizobium sp. CB3090]WFU12344.1 sulfotransferase family 2 domain-containing protein [Rhizobium sp. CB3090]